MHAYPSVPVRCAAEADCPADPPRSWLILPFETPSSTAASPTESGAAQELGGIAGDLGGGALLLAAERAQPAGPLVKHRVAGVVVHLQVQGRLGAARKILDHADDLADAAVEGPQGLCPGMRAGQRGYVSHPPVTVTGHHDVILHRPFSHPFPNTGSRSRSIARKVPGRTSPACWATVVRAVTSVPSARVTGPRTEAACALLHKALPRKRRSRARRPETVRAGPASPTAPAG